MNSINRSAVQTALLCNRWLASILATLLLIVACGGRSQNSEPSGSTPDEAGGSGNASSIQGLGGTQSGGISTETSTSGLSIHVGGTSGLSSQVGWTSQSSGGVNVQGGGMGGVTDPMRGTPTRAAGGVTIEVSGTGTATQAGSAGAGAGGPDSCDGEALRAAVERCIIREDLGMCFISYDQMVSVREGPPDGTIPLDYEGRPSNNACILRALDSRWVCPDWAGLTMMYWCELYY